MLLRHPEYHFGQSDAVKDVVIGAADGLTVPFALAAGLAGAVAGASIVVTAGLAEVAAGAIAMGLGGYLAAQSERDHFDSEYRRERQEIEEIPDEERREVAEVFRSYGLTGADLERVVTSLSAEPARWADFMMRFELGLERPAAGRALRSALTIGALVFSCGPRSPASLHVHGFPSRCVCRLYRRDARDAAGLRRHQGQADRRVAGPGGTSDDGCGRGGRRDCFRGRTNGQLVTIVGPLDVLRPLVVG